MPEVVEIPLEKLTISKLNVRRDPGDISELVESIKAVGILQPILVRPTEDDKYEIIVGSRRFAAAKKAGLKTIPAIVKEMSDDEAIIESLTENIQRGDLDLEEIAEAYQTIRRFGWTQDAFAKKIGKSQPWLSGILTAYHSVIKLRERTGKRYKISTRPSREEREQGILPYKLLEEVEYALKSEEVRKIYPEDKIDDIRVMLVEAIKDLDYDDAKRVIDYFKMYPEKPIEEVKEMALARKTGVKISTYVPPKVMREVEETAEKLGKPVEVILPVILEKGAEEAARRVEVESLLERAPTHVVEVARKMESTMTPEVIKKILELPEEKQREAVELIEGLRLTEEEALTYIESMIGGEVITPPAEEIEEIRAEIEESEREIEELRKTPEYQQKVKLRKNWMSHSAIVNYLGEVFCPLCGSNWKKLKWTCCDIDLLQAQKTAREKFEETITRGKEKG